jgi:serine/threonine-protein kinase
MGATDLAASLYEQLTDCGLMTAEEIEAALADIPESAMPLTEDAFAERLVAIGKLTGYQAAVLAEGRAADIVLGNYVVLDRLGEGGMGAVFKARHRRMKRLVAIKVLQRSTAAALGAIARFQREVESIARLIHPNVVTAFDADEGPAGPFLVMEYVEGSDLANIVFTGGPLTLFAAVDAIMQAARGLEYAHGQGIIHRDIKPGNLLRDPRGTIKITDLGLARFSDAIGNTAKRSDLTQDGSVFGTVDFMSPEQAVNTKHADHRADIYSLGCTLYYLLAGRYMYGGETVMEKLLAHREDPLPRLRDLRPDVPEAVEAVFHKMTAKRPADRYQSMNEVIRALEACPVPPTTELYWSAAQPSSVPADEPSTSRTYVPHPTLVELLVLLVEPSRVQAMVIARHLQALGIRRVQTCPNGDNALETMRGARTDLVVSAMHLPDMTGAQLVERMRAEPALQRVPFILISSETDERLVEPIRQLGAVAILPKPFGLEQLKAAMMAGVDFLSPSSLPRIAVNIESLRVLIVDDSAPARIHVRRVLENLGVRDITQATNGREAATLLETQRFDLVVTDFHMPEMDGRELVQFIRRESPQRKLPVLMVTSESDAGQLAAVHDAGVSAVCDKVFEPKSLRDILERILAT